MGVGEKSGEGETVNTIVVSVIEKSNKPYPLTPSPNQR
jgi:hypothetical protein